LVDLIAGQSDAQSGHMTIREMERIRDQNLIGFLRVLKTRNWGAGKVLVDHDTRRAAAAATTPKPTPDPASGPMVLAHMQVLPGWIDYNGHMTESRYLFASSETTDAFLGLIGAGLEYVAAGRSYYTAESHIMHPGEARLGDHLTGSVQVLGADEKRLHLFMRIERNGAPVATVEQILLHVDAKNGGVCPAAPEVLERLAPIVAAHASLPRPETAGRHVGYRAPR